MKRSPLVPELLVGSKDLYFLLCLVFEDLQSEPVDIESLARLQKASEDKELWLYMGLYI